MQEHIPIRLGRHAFRTGSVEIKQVQGPLIDRIVNGTAKHEAAHTRVANKLGVEVYEATDKPGPGYAGYMTHAPTTDYKSALIAAAPAAKGYGGTGTEDAAPGSDRWHVEQLGFKWSAMVDAVTRLISGDEEDDHIHAIGTQIQQQCEIDGDVARTASTMVEEGTQIAVSVFNEKGGLETVQVVRTANRAQEVVIDLPKDPLPIQEERSIDTGAPSWTRTKDHRGISSAL